MKKLLLSFIVAVTTMVMMDTCVLAATDTVNGITWTYSWIYTDNGRVRLAKIFNNGLDSAIPETTTGAITIPSMLGDLPVTRIGGRAFYNCSGLTSVTIPNSVTYIGDAAFYNCSGLTSVTIPDSVTSIGDAAFYNCSGLTSVTIPDSVTSIDSSAFNGCSGLTKFIVDSNNPNYKSVNGLLLTKDGKTLIAGVNGDVTIPDSVTSIGSEAFRGCSSLTDITIPDSVTNIGSYAFQNCSGLTSITIPDSVTSIGKYAFDGCSSLYDAYFMGIPPEVGYQAFFTVATGARGHYRKGYQSSWLPKIDSNGKWNGLIMDEIDPLVYSYNDTTMEATVIGYLGDEEGVTIPSEVERRNYNELFGYIKKTYKVTSIGADAFKCSSITSITIPDSITSIGENAFKDCNGLTSVTIGNSVTSIGEYAFSGCSGLTSITISDSVTSIGDYAFSSCRSLYDVYFMGIPPEVGVYAFSGVTTGARGHYREEYQSSWLPKIDSNGKWNGLIMDELSQPILEIESIDFDNDGVTFSWDDSLASGEVNPSPLSYTYSIYMGTSNDKKAAKKIASGIRGNTWTTNEFYSINPVLSPLYFWVKAECDGFNISISNCLETRKRHCLAFGFTGDKTLGDAFSNDANLFSKMAEAKGNFMIRICCDCPEDEMRREIWKYAENIVKPGDIFCFFISNHGSDGFLFVEDNISGYTESELREDINKFSDKNVAVISIIMACHSDGMVKGKRKNEAFVVSCLEDQYSVVIKDKYSYFSWYMSVAGWERSYADARLIGFEDQNGNEDGNITFYELANYTKQLYKGGDIAEKKTFWFNTPYNESCLSDVQIHGERLLKNIVVAENAYFKKLSKPKLPYLFALSHNGDKTMGIQFRQVEGAQQYRIYRGVDNGKMELYWPFVRTTEAQQKLEDVSGNDINTKIGKTYSYYIRSLNEMAISDPSKILSAFCGKMSIEYVLTHASHLIGASAEPTSEQLEEAYNTKTVNGYTYGECFVAGLDPKDPNAKFIAKIDMIDGLPNVSWEPDLGDERKYIVEGKENLDDENWSPANDTHKFFRVRASLPDEMQEDDDSGSSEKIVTVFFEPRDGIVSIDNITYHSGTVIGELPTPTLEGHTFMGWYDNIIDGNKYTSVSDVPDEDMVLYAIWEPETYIVKFNANGGTGEMFDQAFTYGVEQTLAVNTFSREGYIFAGWATSLNGDVAYTDGQNISISAPQTLYAVWEVKWSYRVVNGEAEIYGGDFIPAIYRTTTGAITIPSTLGGYPVTSIGSYAFYNCSGLTSITIPDSVTSIGLRAFSGCSGLTKFIVDSNNPSYKSVNGLLLSKDGKTLIVGVNGDVIIPQGVTSIGDDAFSDCSGLTSVTIPNSVTSIGNYVFSGCSGLTKFIVDSDNPNYKSVNGLLLSKDGKTLIAGINGNVVIPDNVTSIGDCAFFGCEGLKSVTIPDSVTSIGESAFEDCSGLTSITIPNSLTSIGDGAFFGCSGLTSVTISNSVTSIGSYAFAGCEGLKSVTIPNSVTSIGEWAFYYCSGLTSITIPDSVTSIGEWAFSWCYDLKSAIFLGDAPRNVGDDIFYDCADDFTIKVKRGTKGWNGDYTLTELPETWLGYPIEYATEDEVLGIMTELLDGMEWKCRVVNGEAEIYGGVNTSAIPEETTGAITIPSMLGGCPVMKIGDFAFAYCYNLTSITIPDSVTSIGNYAFRGCRGLTSITTPNSVTSIGSYAFYDCSSLTSITIPDSVTNIGSYAFQNCSGLTSITIPDSVTSIGSSAFSGCSNLTSAIIGQYVCTNKLSQIFPHSYSIIETIEILNGVTMIGDYAFDGCSGLKSIIIPDSVTSIGSYAFYGCYGLTSITIPDSVTSIGEKAFYYCNNIKSVTVGQYICSKGLDVFPSSYQSITNVVILDGVTSIGDDAFRNCRGLTSITIPDSVTSIGNSAFSGCSGLTSITIPNSVTSIGDSAFDYCSGLTSITIPNSVTSIGDSAFDYCRGLTSITIPNSVTSIGDWAFSGCYNIKSVTVGQYICSNGLDVFPYYQSIINVVISDGVTSIGDRAFEDCRGLTSVTIPNSVTSIGNSAFSGCSGLTSITISNSVTSIGDSAFDYCSGLTSVTIPNSVTSIGYHAFFGCSGLTKFIVDSDNPNYKSVNGLLLSKDGKTLIAGINGDVVIPDSVTSIGDDAFYYCDGLTSITIPDSVTSIGSRAFYECSGLTSITIPDSVTSIGDRAFYECSGLTSITIPDSVTSIGDRAFYECSGLTSITIPDSVTSIGDRAFYECSGLTQFIVDSNNPSYKSVNGLLLSKDGKTLIVGVNGDVIIPQGVTSIGDDAFYRCSGLTSITIPNSVTSIGNYAFIGCSGLTKFIVDSDNPNYKSVNGLLLSKDGKILIAGINGDVVIPQGVTSIGEGAFSGCSGLTSVTIPNSVTSIGEGAFSGCSGLTSVTIPNSVTSIGYGAFYGCNGLTSVTIPNSVTSIGDSAFEGCSGLTSITIPDSVTSIGSYAFAGCEGLKSVTIPNSVTSIGEWAFCWCYDLKSVMFLGDAPRDVGGYPFEVYADDFVIKVKKGTKGWNGDPNSTELPETWYGYPIEYATEDDLYPVLDANATAEDVANALSSSVDENLAKNITSVEMYNNYREWALSVNAPTGEGNGRC